MKTADLVPAAHARFMAVAAARAAQQQALGDDADPWLRADTAAGVWLRSPAFAGDTRDQYGRVYRSWRAWCVYIDTPPLAALRTDVESYALALETIGNPAVPRPRPLTRRSIARHLATLSSFYTRAVEDGLTDRNPVPLKGRPKVDRESRQPHLSRDEIRRLLAAADARSRASSGLVALLVLVCLRVREALAARIEHVAYEAGHHKLWVIRKGDKGEWVPVPPEAWQRLAPLVAGRREGLLLTTSTGRPIDRKAAWKMVRSLGRAAGIAAHIGPHTLRHAYLTRGHELGIPVDRLQRAAGHASVDTTRGYDRSHLDATTHPSYAIAADLAGAPITESPS